MSWYTAYGSDGLDLSTGKVSQKHGAAPWEFAAVTRGFLEACAMDKAYIWQMADIREKRLGKQAYARERRRWGEVRCARGGSYSCPREFKVLWRQKKHVWSRDSHTWAAWTVGGCNMVVEIESHLAPKMLTTSFIFCISRSGVRRRYITEHEQSLFGEYVQESLDVTGEKLRKKCRAEEQMENRLGSVLWCVSYLECSIIAMALRPTARASNVFGGCI